MILALEYIICQLQRGKTSVAIKSHRNRRQNPGFEVMVERGVVTWQLLGLSPGVVESADPENPAATRLDFYISRHDLIIQRHLFPVVRARPSGTYLHLTNPSGSERRGGKAISWRGPISKHAIIGALMVFPTGNYAVETSEATLALINVDWEPAMYPLPDGTRRQLHFGIQAEWDVSVDKRRTIPNARIIMTNHQYADLLAVINAIR